MDAAVELVQAYLQLNGYLTVAEFPIVALGRDGVEMVTDVDLIAVRFPLAEPLGAGPIRAARPDADLRVGADAMDLLICEVKEGRARVNPNLSRADTLRVTLERIGCCAPDQVGHHVEEMRPRQSAAGGSRYRVRRRVSARRGGGGPSGGAAGHLLRPTGARERRGR